MFNKIVNYYEYLYSKGKISHDAMVMIEQAAMNSSNFKSFLIEISNILN